MDKTRWERLQEIFHQASELPALERTAYLAAECGDDVILRRDAEAMLAEDGLGESLLDLGLPGAALAADPLATLPLEQFGPYQIKRLLGRGGMGVVYLAEREDFGGLVAIKLLLEAPLSPSRRKRFAREQRTLARLEHPLIARIYDADTLADGTPWFAMEYVEGVPIAEYCRQRDCSIDEIFRLFRSVCEAVQYAHGRAIVHCDLKPSNILVKADGTVKLLDFGIARQMEDEAQPSDLTRTGLRPMTVAYAAPEQMRGDRPGTQADVYALGVTLYELLTGRLPFDLSNLTPGEAEQRVIQQDPAPPSAVAKRRADRSAWSDCDVLTLTAMHKDVTRRYRSVEAVIRDIDHYLRGEPLEARPDSLPYRIGKFVRRNRTALSAAAATITIFVVLVAFFVVRLARARTAALAEATRTERIERFMLNLFEGGDKTAGPADSLRVVTLLDRGVQNAKALSTEPAVQVELYQTLGSIYQKLGKFDQADPLLRSALEGRKAVAGDDSPAVAGSLIALGLLRLDQGRPAEAERLIRQGLAIDSRRLHPQDPDLGKGAYALGRVLEDRGAYNEAVKTLDDAVRLQSAQPGTTTDLADSLRALGDAHYYLGHLATAGQLYQRALDAHRTLYGAVHPRVADDLFSLGEVQHDLGHDAQAEQYYRQSLGINRSWYGKEHPNTALTMAAVGQALIYQKRYDEAAPVLREALAIQERIFGKVHPQVAQGLNTLGVLELRRKHYRDAEADFARMARINSSAYGDRHYLVGIALLNLGQVYLEQREYARAEKELREALARFTEKLPPGHTTTAIAQIQLGHDLAAQRRYAEAEPHLLAGYAVLVKQPDSQAARLENARKDLVTVDEALGKPDQARKYQAELAASARPRAGTPGAH